MSVRPSQFARDAGPLRRLREDPTPLDAKATGLITLALILGVGIGTLDAALGQPIWPGVLLTVAAAVVLRRVARAWIVEPFAHLLRLLPGLTREIDRRPASDLPTHRTDEVGELARAARDLLADRIATHHDAKQLRRTLEQRVQQATRRATADLKHQANRDPLTDAGNRRFLDEQLPGLVEAARLDGQELVAIAIDMDHFKAVNDTLGHAAGDELLGLLTDLLHGLVRHDDLVIRLGGDEFLVLQPGGDLGRAEQLAEQTRGLYLQQTKRLADRLDGTQPNLSIGVAALLADGLNTGAALLETADQRIYQAKHAGRGRTATPTGLAA